MTLNLSWWKEHGCSAARQWEHLLLSKNSTKGGKSLSLEDLVLVLVVVVAFKDFSLTSGFLARGSKSSEELMVDQLVTLAFPLCFFCTGRAKGGLWGSTCMASTSRSSPNILRWVGVASASCVGGDLFRLGVACSSLEDRWSTSGTEVG